MCYCSVSSPASSPRADTVCEYEVQFHQRLEQERAQWNQYREAVERELGELRRRLSEGQEEENLEDEMKKVCLLRAFFKVLSTPLNRELLFSANMELTFWSLFASSQVSSPPKK